MELKLNPEKPKVKRKGQFPKGNIHWNKGKHYQPKNLPNRWNKNNPAPSWAYEGDIRIHHDHGIPEYYIKLNGKWRHYQRYVWEQHFGTIPPGYIVRYKDGNTLNCDPDNLECISRADNAIRNVNRKKAAEQLAKVWKREKVRASIGLPPLTKFGNKLQKIA